MKCTIQRSMRSASWVHFRSGTNIKTRDTDFRVPKYYYTPLQSKEAKTPENKTKNNKLWFRFTDLNIYKSTNFSLTIQQR